MKVRGFQVAPAELEGHLLDHPDIADACVVGVPDEYSGEVPLAFVALSPDALARVKRDSSEGDKVKASLVKVIVFLLRPMRKIPIVLFIARRRSQGPLQEACGWSGVCGLDTQKPEWKITSATLTQKGQ